MAWKADEYKDPFNDGGEFLRKELSGKWVGYDPFDDVFSDSNDTAITQVDESPRRKRRRQNRSNDCPSNNNGVHSYFKGNDFIIEDGEGNRKILYNYDPYRNNLILEDDEYNMKVLYNIDPYRINICIEDDEDNAYKRFFEQAIRALLDDPNFLLLYVPENGAKMQIVRLSSDRYHQKRVIKRINEAKRIPSFYYALSHLWGLSENNRHLWYEIGDYVDDESGKPVEPVSMRPEKRDTLLALLKDHSDSYWWIDVLCARTDTPLHIMGDIYACCLECISMIDCDPSLIPQLHTMKDMRNLLPAEGKNGITSLDDLFRFKQPDDKSPYQLVDLLFTLVERQWWKRVWTLQEMALPFGEVRLMAETGTHRPLHNTITVDDLLHHFKDLCYFILTQSNRRNVKKHVSLQKITRIYQCIHEMSYARTFSKEHMEAIDSIKFKILIRKLGQSTRQCMDPADYVYGVLGLLKIKIPRMTDPNAVWQRFLSELDKMKALYPRGKINRRAYSFDLQKANNMRNVYFDLL